MSKGRGNRAKGPRIGRPPMPEAAKRVTLTAQRVAPETLATLELLAPQAGGIGRAIDAAVAAYRQTAGTR